MNRRQFIKNSVIVCAAFTLPAVSFPKEDVWLNQYDEFPLSNNDDHVEPCTSWDMEGDFVDDLQKLHDDMINKIACDFQVPVHMLLGLPR